MAGYEEYFSEFSPQSFSDTKSPSIISLDYQNVSNWWDRMTQQKNVEIGLILAAQQMDATNRLIEQLKADIANQLLQYNLFESLLYPSQNNTKLTGTAQTINDFIENNWGYILQVFNSLQNAGATPAQAAGICGNIYQESRFNPDAIGDNGKSHGLFQMNKSHRDAYRKYRQNNGLEDNLDALCSYVYNSAMNTSSLRSGYGATMNMKSSKLPSDTSRWFCAAFERPSTGAANMDTRNMAANLILKKAIGQVTNPYSSKANDIISFGRSLLGGKYVWGGKNSPSNGLDCSGFTQYIYKQFGYNIGSNTSLLLNAGRNVGKNINNARPGDLIIVKSDASRSGRHVEIVSDIRNGQVYTIAARGRSKGITEAPFEFNQNDIITIRRVLS